MDINDFRGLLTAILLFSFVGLWIWAWSSKRKKAFDEAANLPFVEPEAPVQQKEARND